MLVVCEVPRTPTPEEEPRLVGLLAEKLEDFETPNYKGYWLWMGERSIFTVDCKNSPSLGSDMVYAPDGSRWYKGKDCLVDTSRWEVDPIVVSEGTLLDVAIHGVVEAAARRLAKAWGLV